MLAIGLAGSLLGLALPVATNILFETVIPASSRPELVQLVAGIAALGLGGIMFELVRGFLILRVATLLNTDLEGAVWDRLLRLPAGFFRDHAAGDLALRADAINQMRDAVGGTVIGTALSAVFSVSSLALILFYDWRLAAMAVALALIQLAVMTAVNLRSSAGSAACWTRTGDCRRCRSSSSRASPSSRSRARRRGALPAGLRSSSSAGPWRCARAASWPVLGLQHPPSASQRPP